MAVLDAHKLSTRDDDVSGLVEHPSIGQKNVRIDSAMYYAPRLGASATVLKSQGVSVKKPRHVGCREIKKNLFVHLVAQLAWQFQELWEIRCGNRRTLGAHLG